MNVTIKEWLVLTYIRHYRTQNDGSPSLAEIAAGCGLPNRFAAHRTIVCLQEAGLLRETEARTSRGWVPTDVQMGVML